MNAAEAGRHVVAALEGGAPVVEVVVLRSEDGAARIGSRLVVREDGMEGSLGGGNLDALVADAARETLRTRAPITRRIQAPEGEVEIFLQPHHPPNELLIVGAGHIARPLCEVAALVGFGVTVLDDRPGFATRERFPDAVRLVHADFSDPFRGLQLGPGTYLVLVTRGHKYDYDALRDILLRGVELAYIGMVGSQRRVRAALEQLVREGIAAETLSRVYAPIGLDIGAQTPEEIAVSIVSELVRVRRGGTGLPLRDRARVVERWIREPETASTTPSEERA